MDILDRLKLWKCKPPKPPCKGDALDYCECKDIDDAIAEIERLREALREVISASGRKPETVKQLLEDQS